MKIQKRRFDVDNIRHGAQLDVDNERRRDGAQPVDKRNVDIELTT